MIHTNTAHTWPEILKDCGDSGREIFSRDWSKTSLGPIENWPMILRTTLVTCLQSRFPMGINWGEDLIHLYNDAAKPIVGGHDEFTGLGLPIKNYYPEIWDLIAPMFESVLSKGHATWVEDQLVLTRRNGFVEEAYMTWSYSPVRDEYGEIKGTSCSVIETTSKVIGERRLRMLQEMASQVNGKNTVDEACKTCIEILKDNENDIPFAVLRILDKDGAHARVVDSFGISVPDRALDEGRENFHPALVEVIETKLPLLVDQVPVDVKVNGQVVQTPKSVYVLPLMDTFNKNNHVLGFLSVGLSPRRPFDEDYKKFLDILAKQVSLSVVGARSQEKALEHVKEINRGEIKKLSQLLDASPDHVFIFDREGRYIYHNTATADALKANLIGQGRGDESTLNRNGLEMGFEPDFLKRFMEAKDEAFKGNVANCSVIFPTLYGPREFECILSPMYDEEGKVSSVAGVTRDVTDLTQSIKVRDEFLSIASHELKTPLTTLKLQTQNRARILRKGKKEFFSDEKLAKMFHDDDVQINRLNRLIDDMLDASRINAGKIDLHLEAIDIREIIQEVLERMSLQIQKYDIVVNTNIESVIGFWDRYRLEQVFTNLLTNALKYGEKKSIEIKAFSQNNELKLSVSDQGLGIKKADQTRIFQQFERAISSSSVSGLGLGLFIVEKILKLHDGSIKVESKLHKGSTFTVTLPIKNTN